jgi:hypothetical protein
MATSYGKWVVEPAHYVLFGLAALLLLLALINIPLLLLKVKGKGYFKFNAVFQLPISFLIAGLLPPLAFLLILNIAILIALRKKYDVTDTPYIPKTETKKSVAKPLSQEATIIKYPDMVTKTVQTPVKLPSSPPPRRK